MVEWLREYVEKRSQDAFAAIVRQYVDMVYASARRSVGDAALAEDVTQAVFILLARKAHTIRRPALLAGWLLRTTHYAASNARRMAASRQFHEQRAAAMRNERMEPASEPEWETYAPVVDEAMSRLGEVERSAVALRYLRGLSLREVGETMGLSEEAARKRVDRGIAKLRGLMAKQVAAPSVAGLALALGARGVEAAPARLTETAISASAGGLGAGMAGMIAKGAMKMMNMAKMKLAAVVCASMVLAGGGIVLNQTFAKSESPVATTIPTVRQPDSLVQAVLELDGLIQDEKKAGIMRPNYVAAQVFDLGAIDSCAMAATVELPNTNASNSTTARLGRTSLLGDMHFWDRQGRELPYTIEERKNDTGFYRLQFIDAVAPGASFQLITTTKVPAPLLSKLLQQDGKLRYFQFRNMAQDCLNYYELILPRSAIFVDCSFPTVGTRSIDGRTAVIVRNYTGPQADGAGSLSFLWPEKDGTSLADLPGEYRGLREQRVTKLVEEYRSRMATILAGERYSDQSTPMNASLTLNSAIVRKDAAALSAVLYSGGPKLTDADILTLWEDSRPGLADVDLLNTQPWPEQPAEGHLHPIEVCRRGSLMRTDTYVLIYSNGKWYWMGNQGNPWGKDLSTFEAMR